MQLQRRMPPWPADSAATPPLAVDYTDYCQALLHHDAQRARMQGLLDAEGERILGRAAGRAWVKIGEHFYEVVGDARSLRLKLPASYRGVEPALEWSRARGWRWAYRSPLAMEGLALLREVVPEFRALRDVSLQRAQWSTGITDEQVRYGAVNDKPVPGQLLYMARRFETREQLIEAEVHLRAGEALPSLPLGMVQLLTELSGWPAQRSFRYTDEADTFFASQGTGAELLLDVAIAGISGWVTKRACNANSKPCARILPTGSFWTG